LGFYPLYGLPQRVVDPPIGGKDRVSKLWKRHYRQCMAYNLLTPTALRWSTLSSASGKEGKKVIYPGFMPRRGYRFVENK
jgi:hypothetical protein